MNEERISYTTINHVAREKLGLSWLEYGLADLINRLASNPESQFPGWCYASKETLAQNLGVSKQAVHKLIIRLVAKGLVEKNPITKHLKITIDWYKTVELMDSKQSLPTVNNVDSNSKQSLLQTVNKVYTRNKIEKEKENNITPLSSSPLRRFSTLESLAEDVVNQIAEDYHVPVSFVRLQLEKMTNWLGASGKTYKDYNKALRNWVLRDAQKMAERSMGDPTKRAIDARNL